MRSAGTLVSRCQHGDVTVPARWRSEGSEVTDSCRTQRRTKTLDLDVDDWKRILKAMRMFAHNKAFRETLDKLEEWN